MLLTAHRWDEDASNTNHGSAAVHQLCLHIPPPGLWVLGKVLHRWNNPQPSGAHMKTTGFGHSV